MRKIMIVLLLMLTAICAVGCGKHYCSYGGCMREVSTEGGRCSAHQGLKNDPYYGIPEDWR